MKLPVRHADNINLNTSSEEALAEDVGLGPERARRIVENRPFNDWEDVVRIEGFTTQVVDALRASGAQLGDAAHADVKTLSDDHHELLRRGSVHIPDADEGVPSEGRPDVSPSHRTT